MGTRACDVTAAAVGIAGCRGGGEGISLGQRVSRS
jgi:hypothetical protein